jgi:hypothetical protein
MLLGYQRAGPSGRIRADIRNRPQWVEAGPSGTRSLSRCMAEMLLRLPLWVYRVPAPVGFTSCGKESLNAELT